MRKIKWAGCVIAAAAILLSDCASTVKNDGRDNHLSGMEAISVAGSTPDQCAHTTDAVRIAGASSRECIRYFPTKDVGSTAHNTVMAGEGRAQAQHND